MSQEISLFTEYHKDENAITNYCGLLMKMLYESSPRRFEELVVSLIDRVGSVVVGPRFLQQTKMKKGIPDLVIQQTSFSIRFETKVKAGFSENQLLQHLDDFTDDIENKVLFILSNSDEDDPLNTMPNVQRIADKKGVDLRFISFEDFVESMEKVVESDYLRSLLEEFKVFLDRKGALPTWQYMLDVVNCRGTMHEIEKGAYMCPDTGGSYSHRRAKYFGPYAYKKIDVIFEIAAVVVVDIGGHEARVKWKNVARRDEELIREAHSQLGQWENRKKENEGVALQVFLLEKGVKTSFVKETSGGMQQSKKYFWNIAEGCRNSRELAEKLHGEEWGKYR